MKTNQQTNLLLFAGLLFLGLLPALRADTALVFNEIMYHPQTNETAFEWVEFYNQMAVDLDVSGWTIQNGISYQFPAGTIVHGGAYIVVSISPADLMEASGRTNVIGPFTQRLSNSGETLELRNNDGRIVDSISYGTDGDWPVGPDGGGVSLAKLDPNTASAPSENWAMSVQVGGTPGTRNFPDSSIAPNGVVFNEIAAATNAVFWVEVFNDATNDISLADYVLARSGTTNSSYVFPSDQMINAGGFLALDETQLGFRAVSGDRLFLLPPLRDRVLDAVVVKDRLRGRSPDGTGEWRHPSLATPGASNSFSFHTEIVINEIMYDHYPTQSLSGMQTSSEQWIELYNRSSNTVDLTGWSLDQGIQYSFASGQTLAPGGYLVVAKDAAALRAIYPSITIVGDYAKSLSHHNDVITLKDSRDDPADRVHYYDDGRWPTAANRGGSSLELRDPMADSAKAEAWAASDETHKSSWNNYTYTAVAASDGGPTGWNEFVLGLLSDGECLVDDISVLELITNRPPAELVANGDFESGLSGWRPLGNHSRSRVELDSDNPGNHVLHVTATGPTEHMHNHLETTYIGNRSVTNGHLYQVSFRAKWIAGVNLLNTRLYFNRVHQTSVLPVPARNGTPGAQNSRFAANIGPTFSHFQHRPIVPQTNQEVTVSVVAQDPQGVTACSLWWSANGGSWSNSPMVPQGNNAYLGTIPGLPGDTTVQFYVESSDGLGALTTFPARGADSRALYRVNDGQANLNLGHNIRIIMTPADVALLNAATNVMSNDNLGATVVCDEQRAYYNMTLRLKSSERGRNDPARVGLHLTFNSEDLFRGVHPVMLVDRSGVNGGFGQEEIMIKHMMNHAGGFAQVYNDLSRVIGPVDGQAGSALFFPRFEDEFLGTQYPGGADGTLFEYELIYFPLTTLDGTPTGYKLPQPDDVIGVDISDLGDDKEDYRYHYIIKNNREVDDYSRLMDLCKVFSLTGSSLDAQSQRVMDVDQWMRTFVMEALCGLDEIYNSPNDFNYHNVLLYVRSSDRKVVTFPWDMDWCFLAATFSGLIGDNNLGKIIRLPANERNYYAHALDLIDTTFNASYMSHWVSHYNDFCPGQDFSYILPYIEQRALFVRTNLARYSSNSFTLNGANLFSTSSDLITVTGTAPVQVRSILVNGLAYPVTWITVTNWSLSLALNPGTNVFQLQGYDMRGNLLSNATLSLTADYTGSTPNPQGAIVFNEIMYNPLIPGASYVEIFNTSSNIAFDLTGWRLDGVGYTFPPMVITGGQYLVLAKDLDVFHSTYTNSPDPIGVFDGTLSNIGETLSLIKPGATPAGDIVIDRLKYEPNPPWPQNANGLGASLQLIDAAQDNSRVSNWADSPDAFTPGAANSVVSSLPPYPLLWINEIQPDNISGITDNHSQRDPWLELYNAGTDPVSLDGFFLANNYTNLAQWSFPTGTVINGGEFKVIFADGEPEQSTGSELHTGFRLSSSTGSIAFSRTYAGLPQIVDYINYSGVDSNLSYGSFPDGQSFARQEFYYVTPAAPNNPAAGPSGILINEWMASNTGFIRDPADNAADDWFELYNPSTSPVNLEGYYLTDNLGNKFQYRIPAGYVIPPLGHFLVWADNTPKQNSSDRPDLHVNFSLNKDGEAIGLFAGDGTQIDAVTFGLQTNNISRGRYPDGAVSIYYMTNPTPRAVNLPPFYNRPPVLAPIGNQVIFAGQTLSFTASASDPDLPAQTLTLSLDPSAPTGASIDASSGLFTWTPAPAQIPSTNTITIRVTDDGTPNLSATRTFQVLVSDNVSPVLGTIEDQTINELTTLSVTNTATDSNIPANVLSYTLLNPPDGANIDTNGIITWSPSEAQGPGTYTLITVVTDSGVPNLSATNSFMVAVNEINVAPALPVIADQTVTPRLLLIVTNTAFDPDIPVNSLSYTLIDPPHGATIDTNGMITWIPTPTQGPATYTLTTVVTDDNPLAVNAQQLSATNSFTVIVNEPNLVPVLDVVEDQTLDELALLTVINAATDANVLTYILLTPPSGASIDTNGIITWIPSEAQGPGAYTLTTVVTDNGVPNLSATNSFMVVVNEVNTAAVLAPIANYTITEGTLLTFTNSAVDVDIPANTLLFSLDPDAPLGASVDTATGVFTWTPTEAQGPSNYVVTVRVTDNGTPPLADTKTFTVQVNEVNLAPMLAPIGNKSVTNGATLTFTASATDADIPTNALSFSLDAGAPTGVAIDASTGLFTWEPSTTQGPGAYHVTVRVTDDGTPPLSASESIVVTVFSTNIPLALLVITNDWKYDQSGSDLGTAWRETDYNDSTWPTGKGLFYHENAALPEPKSTPLDLTNGAGQLIISYYFRTHFNLPTDAIGVILTSSNLIDDGAVFYLNGAEAARYNMPTGLIHNGTLATMVIGNPVYQATNLVGDSLKADDNVLAVEVHQARSNNMDVVFGMKLTALVPSQSAIAITNQPEDLAVILGETAQFTVGASGSSARYQWFKNGSPIGGANSASYSLSSAQLADAGTYSVVVSNLVSLATSRNASLTVTTLPNTPPVLARLTHRTLNEGTLLTFSASATDTDAPPQMLTFSLDPGAPAGADLTTNGLFTWTPTEEQAPGSYPLTIRVTDNGSPPLSAATTFTVTVDEVNSAPVLNPISSLTNNELTLISFHATANDSDVPTNTLTFNLVAGPTGASLDPATGLFTWLPDEAQGPSSNLVVVSLTDNGVPSFSATQSFTIVVNEINVAPTLPLLANRTVYPLTSLIVTNTASDADIPVNTLSYALLDPPAGASIDTNGVINWIPSLAQAPGTYIFTTVVTDDNPLAVNAQHLDTTNSFTVMVNEPNSPPVLTALEDQTANELTLLTITNTATDGNFPANTLTYILLNPPTGASIDTNGVITWIPSEAQGPGSYTLTTVVTDDGLPNNLSATNSFIVAVQEINTAPTLPLLTNQVVNPLTWLIVTNTASDPDIPVNALSYTLIDPPDGVRIDTNGLITWIPILAQSPGTYTVTTVVTDTNGDAVNTQQLSATNSFIVTVNENTAPLLSLFTASNGGIVDLYPAGGSYPSNTVVQIRAQAATGWLFLGWRGDLDGTDSPASITMTRQKSVQAIFGTSLETRVSGDGAVRLYPTNLVCPFGTTVQLAAVPGANSYFSHWNISNLNGVATTPLNPLKYSVLAPVLIFEAVFESIGVGQATLTIIPEGRGEVMISPQTNLYTLGESVQLLAVPDPGQKFQGWTGDEISGNSSLDVILDHSKVITANFSKRPLLEPALLINFLTEEDFRLKLSGDAGVDYEIQRSSDLRTWVPVTVVNSPFGSAQITDPLSAGLPQRFYRAVSPPGYVAPPPVTLVSTGSVWKYLDNGSDQGTNWAGTIFDDSTWGSGPAQLGYGDGDEATVVGFGGDENNKHITTYFRHSFDVTNASGFSDLRLRLLRDDGAIVYLNGHEVFRSNMPDGQILYSTFAFSGVGGTSESSFLERAISPELLINGINILAVEIHQVSPDSSDISFDFELIGQPE